MNDKEYTYDIDKYTIGVDTNGEDGIGLTVAKIENGEIYFLGNCYGENARCLDLLIKENQELKKQLEEHKKELEKADNLTQICIFKGKEESKISYRKCLNILDKKETQQKEFIKYLEDGIKQYTPSLRWKHYNEDGFNDYDVENPSCIEVQPTDKIFKEILQKYKSIIGDDK